MKNLRTIFTSCIALLLLISACDNEQISKTEEADNPFAEIAPLSSDAKINNVILNNYSSQSNGRITNKFGELVFDKAEIGYSNSSNSIAIVVPFKDGQSSLVVLGNKDGSIHEEFIASIASASMTSSKVNYYDYSGNPSISFSVIDGKIENIVSPSTNGRIADWNSCATCAVTSCGSDGGCTIMCGLLGPWCLAGIAIACIDSDLAC